MVLAWNKLQLGRYIRAVTGHNNLLYHLHNIDNDISPGCRFCLTDREEFHHLAFDCPALWLERQTICSQNPDHCVPQEWTPEQIRDFTLFPKIDEAFAKPLYQMNQAANTQDNQTHTQHTLPDIPMDDEDIRLDTETDTDVSVMDVSSLEDSSSQSEHSTMSNITVDDL